MRFYLRLAALIYLAETIFFIFYRALNLDEGWYLMAVRLVREGKLPYVDFNYTQGPVLPYIYGLLSPSRSPGLLTGRLITWGLALVCTALTVFMAWRLYGPKASLLTLWAMSLGWFAIGQYAYVATYALTGLFLVAGTFCWLGARSRWSRILAALFLVLAVGTRISTLASLLVFWIWVVVELNALWREKASVFGVSFLALGLVFGPFLAQAPLSTWYNLVGFHIDRITFLELLSRWKQVLLSNGIVFSAFWLAALIGLGLKSWPTSEHRATYWLFAVVIGLFLAHLIPRTTDAYYNALQYPLMAILIGKWVEPLVFHPQKWRKAALFALIAINLWGQWVGIKHYRVLDRWRTPLDNLAEMVGFVKANVAEVCLLKAVTLTPILAVETGTPLFEGLEMGIFSYRPTWDAERCRRFHSVNNELLARMVSCPDVGWVAFSHYDWNSHLVGFLDPLKEVLYREYRWIKTFQGLGPTGDEVYFYVRRGCFKGQSEHLITLEWENGIRLGGFNWKLKSDSAELMLFWQACNPVDEDYTVFVHILDEDGKLVYGKDEQPCHNTCPCTSWKPGELIPDEHLLELSALKPGRYYVEIGLYDAQLQRLCLIDGRDAVILLSFWRSKDACETAFF
ncbi:MAG TPA: hypothetical protein ENG33_05490 [Chloroflexi bacterium]|nr:hypothetical protein [Chloroflexota bacterium]